MGIFLTFTIRGRPNAYNTRKKAADVLLSDYKSDSDLTAFTNLDFEDFYETK